MESEFRPEQIPPAEHRYFFLHNNPTPPVGDTVAQADLVMDGSAPTATTLYNYDTNHDSYPGRELRKVKRGGEIDEDDPRRFQDWLSPVFAATATVDGRSTLHISAAAGGFNTDQLVAVTAWIFDYDPVGSSDTLIVSRSVAAITSAADWLQLALHFRPTEYEIPAGHRLRLKVQIDGVSLTVDNMIAYDTVEHMSLLSVPIRPSGLGIHDFSDLYLGGTTSGTILNTGGLTVDVVDLPNPDGFRLEASGGGGTATVLACGATILLTDGDTADITCGSIIVSVRAGEVVVLLPNQTEITLPAGTKATAKERVDKSFDILPDAANTATITVKVRGVEITVEPGVALDASPRGALTTVTEGLRPHVGESIHLDRAVGRLTTALNEPWWVDGLQLAPDDGDKVFNEASKAARDLLRALGQVSGGDDDGSTPPVTALSAEAQQIASLATGQVTGATRAVAVAQMDRSLAMPILDPGRVDRVLDLRADAQEELNRGDLERLAGDLEKAVDRYGKAWEEATKAITEQLREPRGQDEDDDEDDRQGGGQGGGQGRGN